MKDWGACLHGRLLNCFWRCADNPTCECSYVCVEPPFFESFSLCAEAMQTASNSLGIPFSQPLNGLVHEKLFEEDTAGMPTVPTVRVWNQSEAPALIAPVQWEFSYTANWPSFEQSRFFWAQKDHIDVSLCHQPVANSLFCFTCLLTLWLQLWSKLSIYVIKERKPSTAGLQPGRDVSWQKGLRVEVLRQDIQGFGWSLGSEGCLFMFLVAVFLDESTYCLPWPSLDQKTPWPRNSVKQVPFGKHWTTLPKTFQTNQSKTYMENQ